MSSYTPDIQNWWPAAVAAETCARAWRNTHRCRVRVRLVAGVQKAREPAPLNTAFEITVSHRVDHLPAVSKQFYPTTKSIRACMAATTQTR